MLWNSGWLIGLSFQREKVRKRYFLKQPFFRIGFFRFAFFRSALLELPFFRNAFFRNVFFFQITIFFELHFFSTCPSTRIQRSHASSNRRSRRMHHPIKQNVQQLRRGRRQQYHASDFYQKLPSENPNYHANVTVPQQVSPVKHSFLELKKWWRRYLFVWIETRFRGAVMFGARLFEFVSQFVFDEKWDNYRGGELAKALFGRGWNGDVYGVFVAYGWVWE